MSHMFLQASARLRMFVLRHRSIYWLLVGLVAAGAGGLVAGETARARSARASWTETRTALVLTRPLPAGAPITPADVDDVSLPRAAVPPTAMATVAGEFRARHDLAAGEVLLSGHVGDGPTGELPPGRLGVAVAHGPGSLPVAVGSIVDLVVVRDPLGAGGPGSHDVIVEGGTVVAVTDQAVVVAVGAGVAAETAAAADAGRVVLVWRGARSPQPRRPSAHEPARSQCGDTSRGDQPGPDEPDDRPTAGGRGG